MEIPGIATGGGGLSNQSAATSGGTASSNSRGSMLGGFGDIGAINFGGRRWGWQQMALAGVGILAVVVVVVRVASPKRGR